MAKRQRSQGAMCPVCGKVFLQKPADVRKGGGKYCCRECFHSAMRGIPKKWFGTPESTKQERVRANGLVNARVKKGMMVRKCQCEECGAVGRMDSHHEDYSRPDLVEWLCRSCHMKRHNRKKTA
jgi:hypothetical protein